MSETVQQTSPLATISERDPGFDLEAFLSDAAALFRLVHAARTTGDEPALRDRIAPTAWSALRLDRVDAGRKPPAVSLAEPRVTRVDTDAMDTIVVRFSATIDGDTSVQDWVFQRPASAVTGVPRNRCPHCGAAVSAGSDDHCRFCRTPLPSQDWQVTRVSAADPTVTDDGALTARQLRELLLAATHQTLVARSSSRRRTTPRWLGLGTVFRLLVVVAVAAGAATLYGWLEPDSSVHGTVVKYVPAVRRARIDGTLMIDGEPAPIPFAFWWDSPVFCEKLIHQAKAFTVSATGTRGNVTVNFRTDRLSFAPAGPVTASISADPPPPGVHQIWTNGPSGGSATFLLTPDGSGEAGMKDLPPSLTAPGAEQAPKSGSLRWTCANQ